VTFKVVKIQFVLKKLPPHLTNVDDIWCINEHRSIIVNVPYFNKKLQLHLRQTVKHNASISWTNSFQEYISQYYFI